MIIHYGKLLLNLGLLCWSVYIFTSRQSIIVYIGTIIDLVLLILVDILILIYYKVNKKGNYERKLFKKSKSNKCFI